MAWRRQRYSDCALVAAVNARIALGLGDVPDDVYERLVDLTRGRYGACLAVESAYPLLGLAREDGPSEFAWLAQHLPAALTIRDPRLGLHAVLVIATRDDRLTLVNYSAGDEARWDDLVLPPTHLRRCRSFRPVG